ncbi:L-ascorbate metabolism protein UlaG, beta-lactamase superfamily [Seinonella peptonophila]|uniref:UPF0173 metal-dependent hydrolase SAMN05444392_10332 n=1 Tax=Seinonella peptonophila TaxID=112248 RepID=A0A1M4W4E0_9BACL|nr:metal-dependent hydrolase [Seinonella peptonophila]SHE76164.1 L-ascorbate metabolism protein UlaG, beta-lactamase superfamily [Seinonella peptonophila]
MEVVFHGHACVSIKKDGYHLLIDPFITGNPQAKIQAEDLNPDFILLTHGHNDHLGDTVSIAKQNHAHVIGSHELAHWLTWQDIEATGMSIGGTCSFPFGQVKMTPALHGNGYIDHERQEIIYMGMAAGLLLTMDQWTLFHAGDTALFSDLQLIGNRYAIDLAFVPIGDHFTMGPEEAVIAAEWLNADRVIPIHYDTFPAIEQDAKQFINQLQKKDIKGIALQPEERLHFPLDK